MSREMDLNDYMRESIDWGIDLDLSPADFVGREEELCKMKDHVKECRSPNYNTCSILISGVPGCGKTRLAEAFRRQESHDGFFKCEMVSCRTLESVSDLKAHLQERGAAFDTPDLLRNLRKKFDDSHEPFRWLIVLDSVDQILKSEAEVAKFKAYLSRFTDSPGSCLVMTSVSFPNAILKELGSLLCLHVDELNDVDSDSLIRSQLGNRTLKPEERKRLMTICHNHASTMKIAAGYLRNSQLEICDDPMLSDERSPPLDGTSFVFRIAFNALNSASKDLLIRCLVTREDLKHSTIEKLFHNLRHFPKEQVFSQLTSRNFLKRRCIEGEQRYAIPFALRESLQKFYKESKDLQEAFNEALERLPFAYEAEMLAMASKEFSDPESFAVAVVLEQKNLLPHLPGVLDLLVSERARLQDLQHGCRVASHLERSPAALVNLLKGRLLHAKDAPETRAFFAMELADAAVAAGAPFEAKKALEEAKEGLAKARGSTEGSWQLLRAKFKWSRGRLLKEGGGESRLRRSVRELRKAADAFLDFGERGDSAEMEKFRAAIQFDLGDALQKLSHHLQSERIAHIKDAIAAFEIAQQIYSRLSPVLPALFDLQLGLASCRSALREADRAQSSSAARHLSAAENMPVSCRSGPRMAALRSGRACRLLADCKFAAAAAAALDALELRLRCFGDHKVTLESFVQVAEVVAAWVELPRRRESSVEVVRAALTMAEDLARRGRTVEPSVDKLERSLQRMSGELQGKERKEFGEMLEAIRAKDRSHLQHDRFHQGNIPASYEDASQENHPDIELEDSSDASEELDGKDGERFRQLAQKIDLLLTTAKKRKRLSLVTDENTARRIVNDLSDANKMNCADRDFCYEEALRLYAELKKLEKYPSSVIEENRKAKRWCLRNFNPFLLSYRTAVFIAFTFFVLLLSFFYSHRL